MNMKTRYYKTTRMDGGSWYKPEFIYEEGEIYNIDLQNHTKTYPICSRYVLHACNTPERAASYKWNVSWPFRLWSFEGNSVIRKGDKFGFRQIGPMQEEDRALCFGPNGIAVVKMLKVLETASTRQLQKLITGHNTTRDIARETVWNAAGIAAIDTRNATWGIIRDIARETVWNAARDAARDIAWDTVKYTVQALVATNLVGQYDLKQHHIDILMAPWISVFGEDWMGGN